MVTQASAAAVSPQRELLRAERSSRTLTSYLRRSGSPRGFLGMAPSLPPGAERRDSASPRHPRGTRSILHCEVGALPKDLSPPRHNFLSPNVRSPGPPLLSVRAPPALAWKIPTPRGAKPQG